jgi:hypothetical protein
MHLPSFPDNHFIIKIKAGVPVMIHPLCYYGYSVEVYGSVLIADENKWLQFLLMHQLPDMPGRMYHFVPVHVENLMRHAEVIDRLEMEK